MKKLNHKGFTLVELLTVIVILGITMSLSYPAITKMRDDQQASTYTQYGDAMVAASKLYVDSYEEDLFCYDEDLTAEQREQGQCAVITYENLVEHSLLKEFKYKSMTCNSDNTYVIVHRKGDEYTYEYRLGCGDKKTDGSKLTGGDIIINIPEGNTESASDHPECNKSCAGYVPPVDDDIPDDNGKDETPPECGTVTGESTSWTSNSRTISIGCFDDDSGCVSREFSSTFDTTTKVGYIQIKDNSGNTTDCPVNVYVDKTPPSCGKATGASTTWTNESRTISLACSDGTDQSGCSQNTYTKTFNSTTKTSVMNIKDKVGNSTRCSVNVYVDKTEPYGSCSVSGHYTDDWDSSFSLTVATAEDADSGVKSKSYLIGSSSSGTYGSEMTATPKCINDSSVDYKGWMKIVDNVGIEKIVECTGSVTIPKCEYFDFDVNMDPGVKQFDITVDGRTHTGLTDYYYKKKKGTVATISNVKMDSNYEYKGYELSGSMTYVSGPDDNVTIKLGNGDGAIYLSEEPHIYKVTLNPNDGTGGTPTIYEKYKHGWYSDSEGTMAISKVTIPTKEGYAFGGYFDSEGTKVINSYGRILNDMDEYTSNTTLTAKWLETNITIALDGDMWFEVGEEITITATITMKVKNDDGTESTVVARLPNTEEITWSYTKNKGVATDMKDNVKTLTSTGGTIKIKGIHGGWDYVKAEFMGASAEHEIDVANYKILGGTTGYRGSPLDNPTSFAGENKITSKDGTYPILGYSYYSKKGYINVYSNSGHGIYGYRDKSIAHSCKFSVHRNWYVYKGNSNVTVLESGAYPY